MSEDAVKKVGECITAIVGESNKTGDPAGEQVAYLQQWIERDNQQRALRPHVSRMLSTSMWQADAMDAMRSESPEMAREVDSDIGHRLENLKSTLPLPRKYDIDFITTSGTATTVSSTAVVFEALVAVRDKEKAPIPGIVTQIRRYNELAKEQGRAEEAGSRVARLFPSLAERFAEVRNAVAVAAGVPQNAEPAAMQMRTFLDKLKGELFEKARSHEGENMTWERMAERLASGRSTLRDEGATSASIYANLSNIFKARGSSYSFSEVCTRFFDHVFIVCGEVLAGIKRR